MTVLTTRPTLSQAPQAPGTTPATRRSSDVVGWAQRHLPKLVLSPSLVIVAVFVYGFILWTIFLSLSASRRTTNYDFAGWLQYVRVWAQPNWWTSITNLGIFATLYISLCLMLGLLLAILLDQKIRVEGMLRPIYLYPMALSFIVTGTAWNWFLDPGFGLESAMHDWGWESFRFRWTEESSMAIYTIVIAAAWQTSGFVMAMFLAGLRGIDGEILKAAQIDGASTFAIYRRIVIPQLKPVFFSSFIVLAHMAIKSYDLVVSMTGGGPGTSSWLPSVFMYSYLFQRREIGMSSASAVMMLMTIAAIIVPYLYRELREDKRG